MKGIKKKKALVISITALVIIILDQLTKYLIVKRLEPGKQIPLINNFLSITNIRNFGAAFSLFQGETLPLILFSIAVVIIIIRFFNVSL